MSHAIFIYVSYHTCATLRRIARTANAVSHTCQWVIHTWYFSMSHITHVQHSVESRALQMQYVARMNESCHTYNWVTSHMRSTPSNRGHCIWIKQHIWMSHALHLYESCNVYEWVMSRMCSTLSNHIHCKWSKSHGRMRHVVYYVLFTSHMCNTPASCAHCTWMSQVMDTNESCHAYEWVISCI